MKIKNKISFYEQIKIIFFLILFDFYLCVLKDSHFITIFERGWGRK